MHPSADQLCKVARVPCAISCSRAFAISCLLFPAKFEIQEDCAFASNHYHIRDSQWGLNRSKVTATWCCSTHMCYAKLCVRVIVTLSLWRSMFWPWCSYFLKDDYAHSCECFHGSNSIAKVVWRRPVFDRHCLQVARSCPELGAAMPANKTSTQSTRFFQFFPKHIQCYYCF